MHNTSLTQPLNWEHTLNGTPVYHKAHNTLIYIVRQFISSAFLACFWVGGKKLENLEETLTERTWAKPTYSQKPEL